MGLFGSSEPLDSRLSAVVIGSDSADLKKIGKAQAAILKALGPGETLIFVAAANEAGGVWAFTDQRLLDISGKDIQYELPVDRIANVEARYGAVYGKHVRYVCSVSCHGGPLRSLTIKNYVFPNDSLALIRMDGEAEISRVAELIKARVAERNAVWRRRSQMTERDKTIYMGLFGKTKQPTNQGGILPPGTGSWLETFGRLRWTGDEASAPNYDRWMPALYEASQKDADGFVEAIAAESFAHGDWAVHGGERMVGEMLDLYPRATHPAYLRLLDASIAFIKGQPDGHMHLAPYHNHRIMDTRAGYFGLRRRGGDDHGALASYRQAVTLGAGLDPISEARCLSAKQAGSILFGWGDYAGAREMFAAAAQAPDSEEKARAFCLLGMLERQEAHYRAATDAFNCALAEPAAPPELQQAARRALLELGQR